MPEAPGELPIAPRFSGVSRSAEDPPRAAVLLLVVEDEAELGHQVAALLHEDAEVRVVREPEAVLAAARDAAPDLVLADVMALAGDGSALCRALRSAPETASLPVVLIAPLAQREVLPPGWESEADELLFRPFHPQELVKRVRGLLAAARLRRQVEAQRARLETLERGDRELEELVAVASHDLRSPLRAIAQISQWIQEDAGHLLPEESREHLDLLRGRARRLDRMIEAMLTWLRAGLGAPPAEEVDVGELVAAVVDALRPPAGFTVVVAPDLPRLLTPPEPLRQVFYNLIDNAIKYHDRPRGRVEISHRSRGAMHEFTVTDDGPGIPPAQHARAFRVFQTLAPRDEIEASGVGLALVSRLVRRYGGTISLVSEGRGATFQFTWPARWSPGGAHA